jgi:hypothetical protein
MTPTTPTPNTTTTEENTMPTNTTLTGWQADNIKARMEAVARTLRQHERWMRLCDDYSTAKRTHGADSPEAATAYVAWDKGRPISKARKHQAYSDARSIAVALGVDAPAEVRGTVEEWRWAVDVAERACFRV